MELEEKLQHKCKIIMELNNDINVKIKFNSFFFIQFIDIVIFTFRGSNLKDYSA